MIRAVRSGPRRKTGPSGGRGNGTAAGSIAWSIVAQVGPQAALLAVLPLLVNRLGPEEFGVWTLASAVVSVLTVLDGGLSSSMSRFFAIARVQGERRVTMQLLVAAMGAMTLIAGALWAALSVLTPMLADGLDVTGDGVGVAPVFERLPVLVGVGLVSVPVLALLQGHGRFRALAVANLSGAIAFVAIVLARVDTQPSARMVVEAAVARSVLVGGLGLAASLPALTLRARGERGLTRSDLMEVARVSWPLQLAAGVSTLAARSDLLVVAWLLPMRWVGMYGLAASAATAIRGIVEAAAAPVVVAISRAFGAGGRVAAVARQHRIQDPWRRAVGAFCLTAGAAGAVSVRATFGPSYWPASVATGVLVGSVALLVSTSPLTGVARAVGKTAIELHYTVLGLALNAAATILGASVFGFYGVLAGTSVGMVTSTVWLSRRSERQFGTLGIGDVRLWCGSALLAAAPVGTGAVGLLMSLPAPGTVVLVCAASLPGLRRALIDLTAVSGASSESEPGATGRQVESSAEVQVPRC